MHSLFYSVLSFCLLPANYFVLKLGMNRSKEWSAKRIVELTLVIWAVTLVTCAILNETNMLKAIG